MHDISQIQMSKIALLATGDELTTGDILNTNGQIIARTLKDAGFQIGMHAIVSDDENEITSAIQFLLQTHNILIITGGLGPTSDDRTRFALSKVLNEPLVFNDHSWERIVQRITSLGGPVHESNRQQALFPKQAEIIKNPNGTADGCLIQEGNKLIAMLPGPPRECLPMFNTELLPVLQKLNIHKEYHLKWRLFGVSEGQIAAQLDALLKAYPVITGYRWDFPYLEFKIRMQDPTIQNTVANIIEQAISPHIICTTEKTATEQLREKLVTYSGVIVINDCATYGLLQQKITTPATKKQVMFANQDINTASHHLYIEIHGLDDYWQGLEPTGRTDLRINFHYQNTNNPVNINVPFRNIGVLQYAVELISFHISKVLAELF